MKSAAKTLTKSQIKKLSSPYLNGGRKDEAWEIVKVEVDGKTLKAHLRMTSLYTSPTDEGGFHLTQLSTFEFLSQLTIILVHALAGYDEKTRECWMAESSIKCKKAIRDSENIMVTMKATTYRKVRDKILIITKSQVKDDKGLFEGVIKGLVS
ncbi:MAG TPA: hypothetical protein DIV86_06190 [Alphaproteobacteria bacterium]|mgnify:CR=1 FL=1|nr:hypothetical protein [Alphaproteobacteria bacterium]